MKLAKLPSHGMVPGFSGRSKSGASRIRPARVAATPIGLTTSSRRRRWGKLLRRRAQVRKLEIRWPGCVKTIDVATVQGHPCATFATKRPAADVSLGSTPATNDCFPAP